MVYRQHALEMPDADSGEPDRSLARLVVSGAHGANGAHGAPGGSGVGAGADGHPGGDASQARIGQSAGAIRVRLAPEAHEGDRALRLDAWLRGPDGASHERTEEIAFDEGGFIDLRARGGRGGDGGVGGDGGDGARGRRGANASRYSSGGNGGRGGDGGRGGNGTSGASGGSGGNVEVAVSGDDTHLLMLVRHDVRGGDGGVAGRNGRGGSGGAGGAGGSSHHWTTTESYRDANGNSRTRTRHHSNPGGSSGPSGSAGSPGRARLHDGADGPDGRFRISVHYADRVEAYPDRYRLRLVSFQHLCANRDGVYEPDERVEVRGLKVMNVGAMPTPHNHDVQLALESEGWVWPDRDAHLLLPRALGPGEIADVEGSLFFTIGDWTPDAPADAFAAADHIMQGAVLPAAHRAFEGYHGPEDPQGRFDVRFPVQASVLESLHSLAPGEAAKVRFAVRSVSARSFGYAGELGRELRFRLRPEGSELGPEHVTLHDDTGAALPWDEGWLLRIASLGPRETRSFEATLSFAPDAPFYRSARFRLSLELERPHRPEVRPIQLRDFEWRVARRYRRVEGCDLLLVTSHRTTREQIEAWERLAARLGLSVAIWDCSLEGHLDLRAELGAHVGGGSLLAHVSGGTVVILDAEIESAAGPARPHRLLDRDAIALMKTRDVSVAVIGGQEGDVDIVRWLMPDDASEPDARRESPAALRDSLVGLGDLHGQGELDVHEVCEVHHVGFFFEPPTEALLQRRAESLSRDLRDAYPNRRFVVSPRYAPEEVSSAGLVKRWRLGEIEVRTTLESARGRVVHVADRLGEARPEDIDGSHFQQVLLLARDFEKKLERLERAVAEGADALPEVRAILVDLVNEQRAVLASPWRRGLSRSEMERALPLLRMMRDRAGRLEARSPEQEPALIELAARLRYFSRAQPRWWEWPLSPLRRAPSLRRVTRRLLDDWIEATFGVASTQTDDRADQGRGRVRDAWRRVRDREAALRDGRAAFEETHGPADARAHSRLLMREPIEWRGVTSDAELLEEASDRVRSTSRLAALRARDAADDALRKRVREAQSSARERLLVRRRVAGEEPAAPVEVIEASRAQEQAKL